MTCINPIVYQTIKMLLDYDCILESLDIRNAKYLFVPASE
jgi:hypothetical protein